MGVLTRWSIAILLALGCVSPGPAWLEAQDASPHELTAAFLFNFVRFTTWPAGSLQQDAPIVVCVSGSDGVAGSLDELTRRRRVNGRLIAIRPTSLEQPLGGCHVVYGASLNPSTTQQLIQATSSLPILTVGDSSDFAARGGIANFFVDDGRMRFAVNPDAAARAQLQISSKLLSLARITRDGGNRD